jgi:hypothetical protein
MIMEWAAYQYFNPDEFWEIINNEGGCVPTAELEEYGGIGPNLSNECIAALNAFEEAYDLSLSKTERFDLLEAITTPTEGIDCTNQTDFDEAIIYALSEQISGLGFSHIAQLLLTNIENQQVTSNILALFTKPSITSIWDSELLSFMANNQQALQSIIENNSILGLPCIEFEDLHYVGDAVYVNFSNYGYNFLQHSTNLTYTPTWVNFCIQVPAAYAWPTMIIKIRKAFRMSLNTTEASLTRLEAIRQNPIFDIAEIKQVHKASFLASLAAVFGGGVSINTFPGGCIDIPATPFDPGC